LVFLARCGNLTLGMSLAAAQHCGRVSHSGRLAAHEHGKEGDQCHGTSTARGASATACRACSARTNQSVCVGFDGTALNGVMQEARRRLQLARKLNSSGVCPLIFVSFVPASSR
jgi:hypothetical protein